MDTYCAVLMDVISIQKYIFSSNELRYNLGASHMVKTLFEDNAAEAIKKACNINDEERIRRVMAEWRNNPDKILMEEDASIPFEIGVSGGGKALIFFREKDTADDTARKFIKIFTKSLLIDAPGLQLAVAKEDNFPLQEGFAEQLVKLFEQLIINRNQYFPVTTLPMHGITATGSEVGTGLNIFSEQRKKYLSCEAEAKITAAEKAAKALQRDYTEELKGYHFTEQVDQLGQVEGDSYTAIVHIDGNGIGNWFQKSSNLADYRARSINMQRITEDSFRTIISEVVDMVDKLKDVPGFAIKDNLPLRPLIQGGDDLTFICHGKLGLYLAERFLNIWTQKANQELNDLPVGGFSACAGVAIAKTKYPFYRTYKVAEELCSLAKECHREKGGSWLDFYIISGTKSGSISNIRKEEHVSHGLQLYFGPYIIDNKNDNKALGYLKDGIRGFYEDRFWTGPHLKELRAAFNSGSEVLNTLLIDMAARGGFLPNKGHEKYDKNYSDKGYIDKETPYFDMLEIMEFYPRFLLERG
ncbi:hypothetical protein Swol_2528 [Syntrophomonas wolfei subsp. wolfei str. Goettingen G311]|uniref:Cas10/Cmr2 second palm domain-containing protein n=1 Tax=Syntrophomonas wolfei subsp. wolfei (strain DSM 2245B / Goettingen) TaxID=335541 RepID=Q0ATY8_SYNWW|nr:hypothetical protein Swol_2528 [Syntrophomonas wolfei subsp. wolfei str. Goettingen G311]